MKDEKLPEERIFDAAALFAQQLASNVAKHILEVGQRFALVVHETRRPIRELGVKFGDYGESPGSPPEAATPLAGDDF